MRPAVAAPARPGACPRTDLDAVFAREESAHAGVYLLLGTDAETGRPAVSIGAAEIRVDRLEKHRDRGSGNRLQSRVHVFRRNPSVSVVVPLGALVHQPIERINSRVNLVPIMLVQLFDPLVCATHAERHRSHALKSANR